MRVYENLAIQYFNIGDLQRSKIYKDRMMRGELETDESLIKGVSLHMIESKKDKLFLGQRKLKIKQYFLLN